MNKTFNHDAIGTNTCPLCWAVLIPRYEFRSYGDGLHTIQVRYICPDCIPPDEVK